MRSTRSVGDLLMEGNARIVGDASLSGEAVLECKHTDSHYVY